jgi:hypothetical protein
MIPWRKSSLARISLQHFNQKFALAGRELFNQRDERSMAGHLAAGQVFSKLRQGGFYPCTFEGLGE